MVCVILVAVNSVLMTKTTTHAETTTVPTNTNVLGVVVHWSLLLLMLWKPLLPLPIQVELPYVLYFWKPKRCLQRSKWWGHLLGLLSLLLQLELCRNEDKSISVNEKESFSMLYKRAISKQGVNNLKDEITKSCPILWRIKVMPTIRANFVLHSNSFSKDRTTTVVSLVVLVLKAETICYLISISGLYMKWYYLKN